MGTSKWLDDHILPMSGGLDEVVNQDKVSEFKDMTIGELVSMYGPVAVQRGLSYMASLSKAEESYRSASNPERYVEGLEKQFGEIDEEQASDAIKKWEEAMEKGSLGIKDE